jgi:hypothetical protein
MVGMFIFATGFLFSCSSSGGTTIWFTQDNTPIGTILGYASVADASQPF